MGKKCPHYKPCHWQAARRRMQAGQILVVNHALFFADLALRAAGVDYLPKYDLAVFDEAHTLEDVAGSHFGIRLAEGSVTFPLRQLHDAGKNKGALVSLGLDADEVAPAIDAAVRAAEASDVFFERCARWRDDAGGKNGRVREAGFVPNDLTPRSTSSPSRSAPSPPPSPAGPRTRRRSRPPPTGSPSSAGTRRCSSTAPSPTPPTGSRRPPPRRAA